MIKSRLIKNAKKIDKFLIRYLNRQDKSLLINPMKYGVISGGKKIRSTVILSAGKIFNLDQKKLINICASVECIHSYSLIHDDLPCMDDDDYRRGKLSVHKKFNEAIAILAGDGSGDRVSSLNYGAIWYFFEQEINYPLTHINIDKFNRIDFEGFDILIIPDGYYFSLKNEKNIGKIKSWLRNGGKIIAFSKALDIFSNNESFKLKSKSNSMNLTEENMYLWDEGYISYNDQRRNRISNMISGAIFEVALDNTHPMAYGYPKNYNSNKC